MNVQSPQTDFTTQPCIPKSLFDIIEDMYDCSYDLRLIPREMFMPLVGSVFHSQYHEAVQTKDYMIFDDIMSALRSEFTERSLDVFSFEFEAARSILVQPEQYIAMHDAFAAGTPLTKEGVATDLFFHTAPPWTQLQYVLMADHYDTDPDTLGMLVTRAWKTGKGRSIMGANFTLEYCTELFLRCSNSGLNALEPAPKKPIRKKLYRGGEMCPLLSNGMCWTEDRAEAVFFAKRLNKKVPVVLSTPTSANTVLARYEHESEVVLSCDEKRPFEVEFV